MRNVLIALLLTTGCADDTLYRWGDATGSLADSYCTALETCKYSVDPACRRHVQYHTCGEDETCNVAISPEAQELAEECAIALQGPEYSKAESEACFVLGYLGIVPDSCIRLFDFDPAPTPLNRQFPTSERTHSTETSPKFDTSGQEADAAYTGCSSLTYCEYTSDCGEALGDNYICNTFSCCTFIGGGS